MLQVVQSLSWQGSVDQRSAFWRRSLTVGPAFSTTLIDLLTTAERFFSTPLNYLAKLPSSVLIKKICAEILKFITFFSNCLTNYNMTDIETCYKVFRREILDDYSFSSKGFGMEVELTALFAHLNCRVYECPISYYGRTYEDGKKIGLKDGIWALFYIVFYNLIAPKCNSFKMQKRKWHEKSE